MTFVVEAGKGLIRISYGLSCSRRLRIRLLLSDVHTPQHPNSLQLLDIAKQAYTVSKMARTPPKPKAASPSLNHISLSLNIATQATPSEIKTNDATAKSDPSA